MRAWKIWISAFCVASLCWGCKKKQAPEPRGQGPTSRAPVKRAKPSLFDPGAIDAALRLSAKSDPLFASTKAKLPKIAAACKKSKKYLSSFTWCSEWKGFVSSLKPVVQGIRRGKPATVQRALAVALAGVSVLRDDDAFVRYAGLQTLEQVMYHMASQRVASFRKVLARAAAWNVKHGSDYNERKQALRLLGNDGGKAYFHGGVFDGKVLAWAAHHDKSHWARKAALGHLASCIKRLGSRCPVTPAQLKTWFAKEKNGDCKEGIARLAGLRKMTEEVFAWCAPRLLSSKLHWGCRDGFKSVLDASQFKRFHALAVKFRDSDASKTRNNFRLAYVNRLLVQGVKKGFPKAEVLAFLHGVLKQPETAKMRSRGTIEAALNGLVSQVATKKELKSTRKALKKYKKSFTRAWRKDKHRKSWNKLFVYANKRLDRKAKSL